MYLTIRIITDIRDLSSPTSLTSQLSLCYRSLSFSPSLPSVVRETTRDVWSRQGDQLQPRASFDVIHHPTVHPPRAPGPVTRGAKKEPVGGLHGPAETTLSNSSRRRAPGPELSGEAGNWITFPPAIVRRSNESE